MPRLILCFLTVAAFGWPLLAQDSPVSDQPPNDEVIREQTIYIPYTKLRQTFEREGRGVFLPYEKFQELWQAARGKETVMPVAQPPTGAIITEIDSAAIVERDIVRVTAQLTVELLSKGWHSVPIRLGDAAIISAKIADADARVVFENDAGYQLLLHQPDQKPSRVVVTLEYAKAFAKKPGPNSVSFQAPQAPVNRWQVRVPQAGAKINVQPMIAASEVPAAISASADPAQDTAPETVMLAFVGAAPKFVSIGMQEPKGPRDWRLWSTSRQSRKYTSRKGSSAHVPHWPTTLAVQNCRNWSLMCPAIKKLSMSSIRTFVNGTCNDRATPSRSTYHCSSRRAEFNRWSWNWSDFSRR